MKHLGILAGGVLLAMAGVAHAQTSGSGASATSDPARDTARHGLGSTTTGESRSGSGTSTSGGRDANGNQGRDAMPDSSIGVRDQKDQPTRPYPGSKSGP